LQFWNGVSFSPVISSEISLVKLELSLSIAMQFFLKSVVEALMEIETFVIHFKEYLTQLLDLLHHLLRYLIRKVLLILFVLINWIILLRQQLQILFINTVNTFSFLQILNLVDPINRKLPIMLLKKWLILSQVFKFRNQVWICQQKDHNIRAHLIQN